MYRPGTASAQAVTVKTGLLVILPQLKYFRHSSMVFFDRDLLLVLDSERRQGGSAVESRWHQGMLWLLHAERESLALPSRQALSD